MAFISVFDVLGPNMIGPSSSHTAGACAISRLAGKMMGKKLASVKFILYGSFAKTYHGHGTDKALLGGIMGFDTDDIRIRDSFQIAKERGIAFSFETGEDDADIHPNTVDIIMNDTEGRSLSIRGESLGGGKSHITRINNVEVDFSGEYPSIIVVQRDRPGVVAHITNYLSENDINVAFMRLFRESKGETAYTIVESDDRIPEGAAQELMKNKNIYEVMTLQM